MPGWVVGGWIGNRADALICRYGGEFLRGLRTTEPALDHDLKRDLERTTREAYLVATLELVRQAELRHQVGASGKQMMAAGTGEALAAMRRAVAEDLRNVGNTLPQPLQDVELLLEPERAPEERRERIRQTLREMLREGWRIDTRHQRDVPRDWDSLIALAFVEKLKSDERMRTIFETWLLARLAAAAPELSGMAQWPKFVAQLGPGLQRVEDSLGRIVQGMERLEEGMAGLTGKVDALPEVLKTVMEDLVRQYALGSANRSGLTTEEERKQAERWEAQERELRGVRDDLAELEGRHAEVVAEYQKQLAGLGVAGDEEMDGLLRRFAEGDRVGAMPLIEQTKRAAAVRNAGALREIGAPQSIMKDRGELDSAKLLGVWGEAQELDPAHHWGWVELRRLFVEVGALAAARGAAERALETASGSFPREFRKSHLSHSWPER